MSKIIKSGLLIMVFVLGLSACGSQEYEEYEKTNVGNDNNLVTASNTIVRLKSAMDVYQTGNYYFSIDAETEVRDGAEQFDQYKIGEQLSITSNDSQEYNLYQSAEPFSDYTDIEPISFTGEYHIDTSEAMYFMIIGVDGEVDVTISTM